MVQVPLAPLMRARQFWRAHIMPSSMDSLPHFQGTFDAKALPCHCLPLFCFFLNRSFTTI